MFLSLYIYICVYEVFLSLECDEEEMGSEEEKRGGYKGGVGGERESCLGIAGAPRMSQTGERKCKWQCSVSDFQLRFSAIDLFLCR